MGNIYHPRTDEHGKPVLIKCPTPPSPISAWHDPDAIATVAPGGPLPASLNGIALIPWADHPRTAGGWQYVDGLNDDLDEPPFYLSNPTKWPAAGVVIVEPDGRIWAAHPTNAFGGYLATWPKGRQDPGLSLQATAIREAWEETGLQVRITAFLGDFARSVTMTRLYLAERTSGTPSRAGWESQAVSLVPVSRLEELLTNANDRPVIARLRRVLAELHSAEQARRRPG